MNPEAAYDLSDIYLQKLEKCKTIEEMGLLFTRMPIDYTERVKKERDRKKRNIYVEKAKDYIAKNLRREFQIQDMADYFCFATQSHFGKQFKERFGVTPREYRQQNLRKESGFDGL